MRYNYYTKPTGNKEIDRYNYQKGLLKELPYDEPIDRQLKARRAIIDNYEQQRQQQQLKMQEKELEKQLEKQLEAKVEKVLEDLLKNFGK